MCFLGAKYKMKCSFVKANKGLRNQTYYKRIEMHNCDQVLKKVPHSINNINLDISYSTCINIQPEYINLSPIITAL